MRSFAQNFEDVMLERLFADQQEGFYVDVGAWDPHSYSVTRHFYNRGWRGINIEPIEERAALFKRDRDRDTNLCVAVARSREPVRIWVSEPESYLSTSSETQAAKLLERGLIVTEREVPGRTLTDICDEFAPAEIQFIKIDVEGTEMDVLASLDLKRWRPQVLLVEATEPTVRPDWSDPRGHSRWPEGLSLLLDAGYVLAHFDGLNQFYVRVEDRHLIECLQLPPGVFDNIERIEFMGADGHSARLAVAELEDVKSKLEASDKDRAARLAVIECLSAEVESLRAKLDISEQDRAARLEVINRLDSEVQTLRSRLKIVEQDRAQRTV